MSTQTNQDSELEYNDGLGDLLREKEEYEFSWAKTSIVLISVIAIIFLGLTFVFKISKSYLTNSMMTYSEESVGEIDETTNRLDKENEELIKLVENSKNRSISVATLDTLHQNISSEKAQVKKKAEIVVIDEPIETVTHPKRKYKETIVNRYRYKVISGTYSSRVNANAQQNRLKKKSFGSYVWTEIKDSGRTFYKVQAGAFDHYSMALKQKARLKRKGFDSYILIK